MKLLITASLFLSHLAAAETAILCGDTEQAIQKNSAAAVHVDFTRDPIRSKDDVKFFNTFGKAQVVTSAQRSNGQEVLKVGNRTYTFSRRAPGSCDGEELSHVLVRPENTRMNCVCFED